MRLCSPVSPVLGLRRAFTLVELLVVVGIIALLIALLLPGVSRARKQAQMVQCKSNLRQIGVATVQYSQTFRDKYPDGWTLGGAFFRRAAGANDVSPGAGPETFGLPALYAELKYLPSPSGVWVCPSATEPTQAFGNTYNWALLPTRDPDDMGNWTSQERGRFRMRNTNVGNTFWVYDNYTNLPFKTGVRRKTSPPPADPNPLLPANQRIQPHTYKGRQQRAINVLYLDGSVGTTVFIGRTEHYKE